MQEISPDEMEKEPVEQSQAPQEQIPQSEVKEEETKEVPPQPLQRDNWAEANKVLKSQKQEIDALRAHLEEIQRQTAKPEVDEFADLKPDEVITFEMATRLAEKKAEQAARKIVEEYARTSSYGTQEEKTRQKFNDYDYVVEHFAVPLIQGNPALAAAIKASPNPFETAYKLAKTSDAYEAQMTKQEISPKAEKILKNSQRPVTANALSPTLKGQADQFTKMSKEDVWKMSQGYASKA